MLLSECGARALDDDYSQMDGKQEGCRGWDGRLFALYWELHICVFTHSLAKAESSLNNSIPPVLLPNDLRPVFIIIIVSGYTYLALIIKVTAISVLVSVNSTVSLSNLH